MGPESHCTSCFKRVVYRPISCLRHVDVHKGWPRWGSGSCGRKWTGRGSQKPDFVVDVINGWSLIPVSNWYFSAGVLSLSRTAEKGNLWKIYRGVHPLWGNDAFSPCFRFPLCFRKNFQTPWKISPILPFLTKFLDFHPPKFLMTFLSHRLQILNFQPYFSCFSTFPPISRKLLFS